MENNVEKIYNEARRKRETKKKISKVWLYIFFALIKGILAGIVISIGSAIYLNTASRYVGSALFSLAFVVIFSYGFSLFTAKVCYIPVQSKTERLMLLPALLGNFMGAFLAGGLFSLTRLAPKLSSRATEICNESFSGGVLSVLVLSFFCGLLIFAAADIFKNSKGDGLKYLTVVAVSMIILIFGFEHSVSSVFYQAVSGRMWTSNTFLYIFVMTVGNALGGVLIPLCHKFIELVKKSYKI